MKSLALSQALLSREDGEIRQIRRAADETQDEEAAVGSAAPPDREPVPEFSPSMEMTSRSGEEGHSTDIVSAALEATPAAAGMLAELFQGLAGLLSVQSPPSGQDSKP